MLIEALPIRKTQLWPAHCRFKRELLTRIGLYLYILSLRLVAKHWHRNFCCCLQFSQLRVMAWLFFLRFHDSALGHGRRDVMLHMPRLWDGTLWWVLLLMLVEDDIRAALLILAFLVVLLGWERKDSFCWLADRHDPTTIPALTSTAATMRGLLLTFQSCYALLDSNWHLPIAPYVSLLVWVFMLWSRVDCWDAIWQLDHAVFRRLFISMRSPWLFHVII